MRLPQIRLPDGTFNALSLATIGAALVLLIAGVIYFTQQERQREAINDQTEKTNQLIEEVKSISEENRRLNKENRNYTYCNAVLLAKYTQTQQPIVIEDLDECTLTSFPESDIAEPQSSAQTFSIPQTPQPTPASQTPRATPPASQRPTNPRPVTPPTPQAPAESSSTELLKVPELLELRLPCVSALQIIKTCN